MSTKMRDSLGYTVVFTFLLTFLFVFVLAFLYSFLRTTIDENASLAQKRAVLQAMGQNFEASNVQEIDKYFSALTVRHYKKSKVEGKDYFELLDSPAEAVPLENTLTYYEGVVDGKKVVGLTFSGGGMWGSITGVVFTDSTVSKTVGLQIISHSETPGLGARITSETFRDQFSKGVELVGGTVKLVKNKQDNKAGEVNAITGASVTSSSMNALLAEAYKNLKEIVEVNRGQ